MDWREVGVLVGIAAGLSGCYRDSDDFNAQAAEYICQYNDDDRSEPFLDRTEPLDDPQSSTPDYEAFNGPYCEAKVEENLASCSAECDYSPRKARRCLRKLKRGVRRDRYNDSNYAVCDRVYDCDADASGDVLSQCRITTQTCAVGEHPPPPAFLALACLGLWVRRRR